MKIFCIARNYVDHARELKNPVPKEPVVFIKPPTAILRENKPFYHPEFSNNIHWETEIVFRVCNNGKYVSEKLAHSHYDAVGLGIDFTARDLQEKCKEKGWPWEIAKGFDKSAVISKFIEKAEFKSINNINFRLDLNGKTVQQGNSKDMIFNIDKIIAYISQYFTINIGDYIYTGTPIGVGQIKIGDKLEGYIEDRKMFKCDIL